MEGNISSIGDDGSLNFEGYSVPIPGGEPMFVDAFSYNTKSFKKTFEVATPQLTLY